MTDKKLRIATGTSDFKKLITTSDVYVDQTLFIKEFLDTQDDATLITRPRRWGKSLILDITRKFFALEVDENGQATKINSNRVLFAGGAIKAMSQFSGSEEEILLPVSKLGQLDSGKYLGSQGKYPVIYMDFQNIKSTSYNEIEKLFIQEISRKFSQYSYLDLSSKLGSKEKEDFAKYAAGNITTIELKNSLKFLTELLHKHHGIKVIVLIDEYDKPVNNLLSQAQTFDDKTLQDSVVDLLGSILTPCGKGNDSLEKILLVGIFDTVKKAGNSGFSNIQVYGINNVRYGQHFGFSNEEVNTLVAQLGFNDTATQHIQRWYNGYNIPTSGTTTMKAYTPWAVMNYLKTAYLDNDFNPKSYWVTSGASDILERLLNVESCVNSTVSKKFADLTNSSKSVELSFSSSASLFRYDLSYATREETIFSYLLLNSGYLTVALEGERYMFHIPNTEVKEEFATVASLAVKNALYGTSNFCRKILDNLNKPKHIKAVKAIRAGNQGELEHLFKAPGSLRCEDESLNFNYFHMAVIYGNEAVFKVLQDNCEVNLLQAKDAYNLKPIDYAYMLSGGVSMSHFGDSVPLGKSGTLSWIFCEQHAQAMLTAVSWISGTTLALCSPASTLAKVAIIAGSGILGTATAYSDEFNEKINDIFHCDNYKTYSSIDISTPPTHLASPGQFLKYKAMHQEAYIVRGDKCNEADKLIAQKSFHIFSGSDYADEAFSLSICGKSSTEANTEL